MEPWTSGANASDAPSFAALLRQARTAAALSQEELAERAGLSARGVSDLERGIHPTPRLETIRMLSNGLALDDAARAALIAAARPSHRDGATPWSSWASLPVPPTRLIGREREVAVIDRALRDDAVRLLTLIGPGGSGKTRLAIAAAATLSDRCSDGAVFVDLAPLAHPALVPAAVAQAFGLGDLGGREPVDVLRPLLAEKRVLLLLDNFEHVLAGASFVSDLLATAPGLTVLATSREPLCLRGEREIPVPPLGLPDPYGSPELAPLDRCEAVALFVERARDARHDFALTEANAADVAAICRRLDGLPLAIELAAPQIRILTPHVLSRRLASPLAVLTEGRRDAPLRQRSLRDTIAWSHGLLSADEQRLFRTLGVFVGGWTLDAAEAVAGSAGERSVFATLAALVQKNLVRLDEEGDELRYAMLETVREFALEQLAASGEANAVRDWHAAWCLALAEVAEQALEGLGGEQARWFARIDAELGNVRAALAWHLESGNASRLLRLVTVLDTYWFVRPYQAETLRWLETGLRAPDVPAAIRSAAVLCAIQIANHYGDHATALAYAEESCVLADAGNDPFQCARAYDQLGATWEYLGDLERAAAGYAVALPLFREIGVPAASWLYLSLMALGNVRLLGGDLDGAIPLLDEALVLVSARDETDPRALRDDFGLLQVLATRAYAARAEGDHAAAARMFAESLALSQELGVQRLALGAVSGIAGLALDRGQAARAARLLGAVDSARDGWGMRHVMNVQHAERIAAATRAALAEDAFTHAWEDGLATPYDDALADALSLVDEMLVSGE